MSEQKTCESCRWWSVDKLGDGYCCNSDSPLCAECTPPLLVCPEHQPANTAER